MEPKTIYSYIIFGALLFFSVVHFFFLLQQHLLFICWFVRSFRSVFFCLPQQILFSFSLRVVVFFVWKLFFFVLFAYIPFWLDSCWWWCSVAAAAAIRQHFGAAHNTISKYKSKRIFSQGLRSMCRFWFAPSSPVHLFFFFDLFIRSCLTFWVCKFELNLEPKVSIYAAHKLHIPYHSCVRVCECSTTLK